MSRRAPQPAPCPRAQFLGNAGQANELWIGDGTGQFTAGTGDMVTGVGPDTYAAAWADVDNDGDVDLVRAPPLPFDRATLPLALHLHPLR